jgi:hypothetical protein
MVELFYTTMILETIFMRNLPTRCILLERPCFFICRYFIFISIYMYRVSSQYSGPVPTYNITICTGSSTPIVERTNGGCFQTMGRRQRSRFFTAPNGGYRNCTFSSVAWMINGFTADFDNIYYPIIIA